MDPCDICRRGHHPQRLPFYCATDVRNLLYEKRFEHAKLLLETDELEQRANGQLKSSQPGHPAVASDRDSHAYVEHCGLEEQDAKDCTEKIIASAEKLQKEVDEAKKEIEERKAAIARRKADLAAASQGIAARRSRELEETKKTIKMIKYRWDREHDAMSQYRAALCAEVAKLYRLQRVRRGNPVRFEYKIGGLEVVDLHHLSSWSSMRLSSPGIILTVGRHPSRAYIGISGAYSTSALSGFTLYVHQSPC